MTHPLNRALALVACLLILPAVATAGAPDLVPYQGFLREIDGSPLNAIVGFAEILENQYFGELNERQLEYSQAIVESSHRLITLINDILDFSKIEAGHLELEETDEDDVTDEDLDIPEMSTFVRLVNTITGFVALAGVLLVAQIEPARHAVYTPDFIQLRGGSVVNTVDTFDDVRLGYLEVEPPVTANGETEARSFDTRDLASRACGC